MRSLATRMRTLAPSPSAMSGLHAADLVLLARIAWRVALVAWWQHRDSVSQLVRRFDGARRPAEAVDPHRLAWLTRALLVRLYGADFCMKQALVLFYFLRKGRHAVRLHFGVAKRGATLAGHAWVTLEGAPLAEAVDPRATYATTFAYPDA